MLKIYSHKNPTFNWTIDFVYSSFNELDKYMESNGYESDKSVGPLGRCYTNYEKNRCWIWIRHKHDYGSLAHECVHAVLDIYDHCLVKYHADNSEHLCYFIQELVDAYLVGKKEAEVVDEA